MKLKEFIEKFVEHNSIIRLVYKENGAHKIVQQSWNDVSMEHQILNGKGINRHYINNEVIGICSIYSGGGFPEAINISIEKLPTQLYLEETEDNVTNLTVDEDINNIVLDSKGGFSADDEDDMIL
jgi:hypothetical protein